MIKVEKLSYSFPEKDLYKKISFTIEDGEHAVLIGSNGTGKTTLIDILMNTDEYLYTGKVIKENIDRIGYVSQFVKHEKDCVLSVYDYLSQDFLAMLKVQEDICTEMETAEDFDEIMERYQNALDEFQAVDGDNYDTNIHKQLKLAGLTSLKDLSVAAISGGEFKLVEIIRQMLRHPGLLIMDEPDVFLDFENLNGLRELINSHKGTMLVITHNRYLLNHCFNKILHLENADIQEFEGGYVDYNFALLQTKIEMQEAAAKDLEEIARQENVVKRMRASATAIDNAAKGRQLKARVSLLERLKARAIKAPFVEVRQPEIHLPVLNEKAKSQVTSESSMEQENLAERIVEEEKVVSILDSDRIFHEEETKPHFEKFGVVETEVSKARLVLKKKASILSEPIMPSEEEIPAVNLDDVFSIEIPDEDRLPGDMAEAQETFDIADSHKEIVTEESEVNKEIATEELEAYKEDVSVPILTIEDYGISFDELLLEHVNLELGPHDKVAIVGPNGTGKTTLLRDIYRNNKDSIIFREDAKVGFLSQIYDDVLKDKSTIYEIFEELGLETKKEVREYLSAYCFPEDLLDHLVEQLSGGEKNLLQLAMLGLSGANVLLLDEPTSHLDTYSQIALEKAIREYQGAVLMVSHDFYTIANCVQYVYYIEEKTIRKMSGRAFRKMIYKNHFPKDYLELEKQKKELETRIQALLQEQNFEAAKVVCEKLEPLIQKMK